MIINYQINAIYTEFSYTMSIQLLFMKEILFQ